jgi:hypothetical protein
MPQKETLDKAAYTFLLISYRRLSAQFQFSLSADTLEYLSQWSIRRAGIAPNSGKKNPRLESHLSSASYFGKSFRQAISATYSGISTWQGFIASKFSKHSVGFQG